MMGNDDRSAAEYLTVAQVAALLHTKPASVSRLLRAGKLAGINLGTREGWRVRRAEVDALISKRQKGAQ